MKKIIILSFIMRAIMPLEAQEMLGINNSNYAGVNAIALNPALMADSKLYLDIGFLATDVFYQTDLSKNAYGNFRFNGPSVMVNRGKYAFAFTNALRTDISYKRITQANPGNAYNVDMYKVAGLAWGEAALSYAYIFHRFDKNLWMAGVTMKFLGGAGGAYFANHNMDFNFNRSFSDNLNNIGGGGGKGFGADLGIVYEKKTKPVSLIAFKKMCQQKYADYVYRVGLSLTDIGSIRFSNNVNSTKFNKNLIGYIPKGLVDTSYISDTSQIPYNSSMSKNKFSMNLPTAICLQLDYHYYKNWYFNGMFIQGLNVADNFVRRPTMIAITPRFEKRWLEFNLPISLSDMKYFRIGLSMRLMNFTIGTDNLFGSMGAGSNAGFDLYASLKINFAKGKCGHKKGMLRFSSFKNIN